MSEKFSQPEEEGALKKPPQSKGMTRREAMRAGLFAAIAAAAGNIGTAEAQTKKAALSSWNPEVLPTSDFDRMLDRGEHMTYWRKQLENFQARLRSPETRKILTDDTEYLRSLRLVHDHPPCFFEMTNEETREMVRDYFAKRNVLIAQHSGKNGIFAPTRAVNFKEFVEMSGKWDYGNGVVLRRGDRYFIATNAHVIAGGDIRERVKDEARRLGPPDVAFYEADARALRQMGVDPQDAIDVAEPVPADKTRLGTPIFSRPFDSDKVPGKELRVPQGFKEWFGMRLVAQPGLNSFFADKIEHWRGKAFFVTSQGETESRKVTRNSRETYMFGQGTSGGGVAAYIGGRLYFEGLISHGTHMQFIRDDSERVGGEYQHDYSLVKYESREDVYAALNDERRIFKLPPLEL